MTFVLQPLSPNNVVSSKSASCTPIESPTSVASPNFAPKDKVSTKKKNTVRDALYTNLSSQSVFKLLENLKWKESLMAMKRSPDELTQWITKNDKRGMKLIFRRLPIHEACVRETTPEIMLRLLDLYRLGAQAKDNNSRTPLHHAFIHNADINVIYQLVHAYPEALDETDFWGKTAREYAILSKSIHKKEIMTLMSQSHEEISLTVREIEARIFAKQSTLEQMANMKYTIRSQPNQAEMILITELEQARVESDMAYSQRDIVNEKNVSLVRKIELLEKEIVSKNESLKNVDDVNSRNKSLNALMRKYDHEKEDLEAKVMEQNKSIEALKRDRDTKMKSAISAMEGKKAEWNMTKQNYDNDREKMKMTIATLSEKLLRMNSNLDDTILVLENDLNFVDVDERTKSSAEEKVKHLEELVELYKENSTNSKTQLEQSKKEKTELETTISNLNEKMKTQKGVDGMSSKMQELEREKDLIKLERDEFEQEVKVYSKCLCVSKERIASLEDLVSVYQNGPREVEDELRRTKASFLHVMDQLVQRTQRVGELEDELEELSVEVEMMRDSYRMYNHGTGIALRDLQRRGDLDTINSRRTRSPSPFSSRRRRSRSPFTRM